MINNFLFYFLNETVNKFVSFVLFTTINENGLFRVSYHVWRLNVYTRLFVYINKIIVGNTIYLTRSDTQQLHFLCYIFFDGIEGCPKPYFTCRMSIEIKIKLKIKNELHQN
jgi:hypothetical protein